MTIPILEEYVLIEMLCSRYDQAIDARDARGWSQTFAVDGVLERPDGTRIVGRTGLRQFLEGRGPPSAETDIATQHLHFNLVLESGTAGKIKGSSYFLLVGRWEEKENIQVLRQGRYSDEIVREAGEWRFLTRGVTYLNDSGP